MAIKNILIHLTHDPRNEARTETALSLARRHDSHVTALYISVPPQVPAYVMAYIPPDVLEKQAAESVSRAERAKGRFIERCERAGVPYEWRQTEGDPRTLMAFQSHYADVVVVGQTGSGDDVAEGSENLADELVLTSGRPVLVVPYVGSYTEFGNTVLLAWNSTRESARAVHDAMDVLKKASKVIVFTVNGSPAGHIPGADIATHLARHGVKAETHHTVARDISVGDAILGAVSDYGADLVVMGAYGHSRVRELALGGATRTLLETMTVPVMMSH